jgi:Right handed beta helix region/Putative Ig domain
MNAVRFRRVITSMLAVVAGTLLAAQPGVAPVQQIPLATGSGITMLPEIAGPFFDITTYGASSGGSALANQKAINDAIAAASAAGGGTVVVPSGDFKTYTIRLKSRVGLHMSAKTSILRAAIAGTAAGQDGGFYDVPETNLFVGLQDHGHSHWANSLIYGADVERVTISGPGLIDGSRLDSRDETVNVLSGGDPREVVTRTDTGTPGGGNKAIALKNARQIVFRDFSIKNGGHFAILGTGVVGWTVDGIIVDTNRDAFDIDDSQNLTIRNSVFNSLTDDAIVLKASFGLGAAVPIQNVLIENCTVSGYDAGSVIDKVYSTQKQIASDRDGPTARIKLGTEGTTGFNTITIRHVVFDRSRGFALESVDGAELRDIVLTDATMTHVSSSPIFIRLGDRGRAPVTGRTSSELVAPERSVRLDDRIWVLPALLDRYGSHPPVRYVPSYDKTMPVEIGGADTPFTIVNAAAPTRLNPDATNPSSPLFANAVGAGMARVRNISISRVTIEDVDPRYPILIAGLVNNPIENVSISDVSVQYRGGLKMEHAVEQRQLNQPYTYTGYQAAPASQSLPWLVNTFFSKNEALLPRIGWNRSASGGAGGWTPDPYNIPEMPREYPEPSNFGVLPAYGLYARHVRGLTLSNISFSTTLEDERPAVVLDDVETGALRGVKAQVKADVPMVVRVTNTRKREAGREYVKDEPYETTTVKNVAIPAGISVQNVMVDRPAPGTPPDALYALPTAPSAEHPYAYAVANADYPKPRSVYRPFFDAMPATGARPGEALTFVVNARNAVEGVSLRYSAGQLPTGAAFDPVARRFTWTPTADQTGAFTVQFTVDDGLIPVHRDVVITVAPAGR